MFSSSNFILLKFPTVISFVEYIYNDVTLLMRLAVTTMTGILYGVIALDAFLHEFRQNKTNQN